MKSYMERKKVRESALKGMDMENRAKKASWRDKPLLEVTEQCKEANCLRIDSQNYCYGWTEPARLWREGNCPHILTDKAEAMQLYRKP